MPAQNTDQLTSATTLTGSELIPLVKDGVTTRISHSVMSETGFTMDGYTVTDPAIPTSGMVIYGKNLARDRLAWMGTTGVSNTAQSLLAANKVGFWTALGNSSLLFNNANPGLYLFNFGHTTQGSLTAINVATTNLFTSMRRLRFTSASTVGATTGTRHGLTQFSAKFGYEYIVRCGWSTNVNNSRSYIGMLAIGTALALGADSSGVINCIGFAKYAADTNWRFQHNDASGSVISVDLGSNFPANTSSVDMYEFRIYVPPVPASPPGGYVYIYWSATRLNTGDSVVGTVTSTDIPATTQLMSPQICAGNGSTASSITFDVVSQYIETDN